jgi:probable HAF family extracellular repeat protein
MDQQFGKRSLKYWAAWLALSCGPAAVAQSPGFTSITYPGAVSTGASGVNDKGDVVGVYRLADKSSHGYLYHAGTLTPIDYPNATSTDAYGINNAGDIAGDYTIGGKTHGFILSQGRFTTLDVPGSALTSLAAINSAGNVIAFYTLPDGTSHSAVSNGDRFINIDIPNPNTTSANGFNDGNDVVGNETTGGITKGFILSKGKVTPLTVPAADFTGAFGIDPAGNVVGGFRDSSGVTHAYIYSGGAFTTVDIPGASSTAGSGINSVGDIVGKYTAGGVQHGFLLSSPILSYSVTDLGTLPGGSFSQGAFIANSGLIAGISDVPGGVQHAALFQFGSVLDIAPSDLRGVNSGAFGVNPSGVVDGSTETNVADPNGEDFCAYGTHRACKAFLWQNGATTLLPTLGGNNATVGNINRRGQVIGTAEKNVMDRNCPAPQVLQYEAVIWGPRQGGIRELAPLPGDTVGEALWINDNGQAAGMSGGCDTVSLPPLAAGLHAVLWDVDGTPINLGNLGGTTSSIGVSNVALSLNNSGQVVGASATAGNKNVHAYMWTKQKGMQDLGVLPGDVNSAAQAINDRGEVVGGSFGPEGPFAGMPDVFLWRNGLMMDLNALALNSPLHLILATSINSAGEITGFGVTESGDLHAFLATPQEGTPVSIAPSGSSSIDPAVAARAAKALRDLMKR